MMKFHELLTDKIFDLPKTQDKSVTFVDFIEKLLNEFLRKVENLSGADIDFDQINISHVFMVETQKTIVNGLIDTIKEYYNGFPSKAYEKLSNTLKNEVKDLYNIIKQKEYLPNENFYRIRKREDNFTFSTQEMFHIPFELRGKVKTQRYSIPGFPTLYLGRSLYVCWEELYRPQINGFQAVRLANKEKITFLDLSPPIIKDNNFYTREAYRYFMTWPLIACCSIKVKNDIDIFKPEYIIPQLLLQWIRENDKLDGIQYKSTHIDSSLYKQEGELTNLVLPIKENNTIGHCKKLLSLFDTTEVVSWQLFEYALGGKNFIGDKEYYKKIDNKLPKLELIKGRKYPYSHSVLGNLERYLDGMTAQKFM